MAQAFRPWPVSRGPVQCADQGLVGVLGEPQAGQRTSQAYGSAHDYSQTRAIAATSSAGVFASMRRPRLSVPGTSAHHLLVAVPYHAVTQGNRARSSAVTTARAPGGISYRSTGGGAGDEPGGMCVTRATSLRVGRAGGYDRSPELPPALGAVGLLDQCGAQRLRRGAHDGRVDPRARVAQRGDPLAQQPAGADRAEDPVSGEVRAELCEGLVGGMDGCVHAHDRYLFRQLRFLSFADERGLVGVLCRVSGGTSECLGTQGIAHGAQASTGRSANPKTNMWDLIAFYLRFLRNQRGLSGTALGSLIKTSTTDVSRIETGQVRLDGKRALLVDKAWNTGGLFALLVWYASLGHDPEWFAQYKELEQRARFVRIFEAQVIPGLLQIADYARALILGVPTPDPEARLERRMARQEIFSADPAPQVGVLLSQNALEWPVGSPEIMRAQLAALLEASERYSVRIVPRTFDAGAYPGLDGSFTLMSGDDYGEVAYTESPEGGRLVSSPPDVRLFAVRYDRISGKALPEGASRDLIRKTMEAFQ